MSYDNNNHQASAGVYPPKQEVRSPSRLFAFRTPMQGYYEAGPYVAPPPVTDPMKFGPQHHQQPPPPPERTSQRDDDFCTGWSVSTATEPAGERCPPLSQAYALPVQAGPYVAPPPVYYPATNGAEHTKISRPLEKEEA